MNPIVDESREKFSWGNPDAETLREFAKTKFGWTRSKTDDILLPVLKKLDEKKSQASIRNYFKSQQIITNAPISLSKRVQSAINRMDLSSDDASENKVEQSQSTVATVSKVKQLKRQKSAGGVKKSTAGKNTRKSSTASCEEEISVANLLPGSETSKPTRRTRQKKNADNGKCTTEKIPKIPNLNPPIRQRVKDLAQFEANKQKAIEIMKKKK